MTGVHSDKYRLFFRNYRAGWIHVCPERLHRATLSCNISNPITALVFEYNYNNQKLVWNQSFESDHVKKN